MDPVFHSPDEIAPYLGFLMHRRRSESNEAFLQYFGFKEDPFRVSPDPRYMYPSRTHQQALAALENGFYNNRGFIAMIAPPGMGKTTLLYRFLEDTQATARSVFLFDIDSECKPRDFVGYILREFGVNPAQSSSEMHSQLGDALIKETEAGRKCVVVIDEAQNLSDAVLERVRLITNFENSEGKLLQIILSGQPQLTDKLLKESLVQLRQRISTFCHLDLLTPEETSEYVDFRLRQAGYVGDPLFSEGALRLIVKTSKGTPRTINNLCFNALALCCTMESKQVDGAMIAKVVASLQLNRRSRKSIASAGKSAGRRPSAHRAWRQLRQTLLRWGQAADNGMKLWIPAAAAVLILSILGVLRLSGVGDSQSRNVDSERPMDLKASSESIPTPVAPITPKAIPSNPHLSPKPIERGYQAGHINSSPSSTAARAAAPLPAVAGEQATSKAAEANSAAPQQSSAPARQSSSPPRASTVAQASLSIDSIPPGADIEIDGAFVGNTPSTVSVAPGSHQVTARKKGFTAWSKTLAVTGGTIHMNAELEPEPEASN
jgi:general secretion pathway protein A